MFRFLTRIRIFSVIIFSAVLMLSFKISDILSDIQVTLDTFSISKVQAQVPAEKKSLDVIEDSSALKPIKASMVLAEGESDPTLFTKNDISKLLKLAARRESVDVRSEELTLREGLLGAAEKRIDKKILELKKLIVAIKKTIKKQNK